MKRTMRMVAGPRGLLTSVAGIAALGIGAASAPASASEGDAADVGVARAALEKWVETRRIISKERSEWALGREILTDRIRLVQSEIEDAREEIELSKAELVKSDETLADLESQRTFHEEASTELSEMIVELEARTQGLLARMPEPVLESTRPIAQRFPSEGATPATAKDVGGRFLSVIGVLNELNRFHREITVTSEVRDLPNGTTAEVTALYIGVSQAYYVNGDNSAAGVGTAGPDGWEWTAADSKVATAIRAAIEVLQNQSEPAFVQLPIQLR